MATIRPTIVFVPARGITQRTSQLVIDRLRNDGYPIATVELPTVIPLDSPPSVPRSQSHQIDATAVRAVVEPLVNAGKEVIVLCHSYGGIPTREALTGLSKDNVDQLQIRRRHTYHLLHCHHDRYR